MLNAKFPLPTISFEVLKKVIYAYYRLGESATLDAVCDRSDVGRDAVTRSNPFLSAVGLIDGGKSKVKSCTELCTRFGSSIENALDDDVVACVQEVVREVGFFDEILSVLKMKRELARNKLIGEVVKLSGKKRNSNVATGANCVIDMLIISGNVEEVDGVLVVTNGQIPEPKLALQERAEPKIENISPMKVSRSVTSSTPPVVINLQLELPKFDDAAKYEMIFAAMKKHLFPDD